MIVALLAVAALCVALMLALPWTASTRSGRRTTATFLAPGGLTALGVTTALALAADPAFSLVSFVQSPVLIAAGATAAALLACRGVLDASGAVEIATALAIVDVLIDQSPNPELGGWAAGVSARLRAPVGQVVVLPETFAGHPVRFATTGDLQVRHRVQVEDVAAFVAGRTGLDASAPLSVADWLSLTGQSVLDEVVARLEASVTDPAVRALPRGVGSAEQRTSNVDVLVDPARRAVPPAAAEPVGDR